MCLHCGVNGHVVHESSHLPPGTSLVDGGDRKFSKWFEAQQASILRPHCSSSPGRRSGPHVPLQITESLRGDLLEVNPLAVVLHSGKSSNDLSRRSNCWVRKLLVRLVFYINSWAIV